MGSVDLSRCSIGLVIACYLINLLVASVVTHTKARKLKCAAAPYTDEKRYLFGLDNVLRSLGSLKQSRFHASMKKDIQKFGNTHQVKTLGGNKKIISIELDNIKSVFASDFKSWGVEPMRLFPFMPFIGPGILITDGHNWKSSRETLHPIFERSQISNFSRLQVHVDHLLKLIPGDGKFIDLQPLFARYGLDSSTDFIFGESVGSMMYEKGGAQDVGVKSFLEACDHSLKIIGKRMQLPHFNIFTRDPTFWQHCKSVRVFVDSHVESIMSEFEKGEKSSKNSDRFIFARELVKGSKNRDYIRTQLLNVFIPARDAAGVTLTNVFFQLARHPEVWAKLRKEIFAADIKTFSHGLDNMFASLKGITYLQYVLKETLRLHPPIGIVTRKALKDTVLPVGGGGEGTQPIFIAKGDEFSASYYALHRRTDIFGPDADDFKPERWETLRPPYWGFLPFSGGPRHCPGQQLALAEASYAIVRIVQSFRTIENRDPITDFIESYKITTESQNGAKVAFYK